MKKFIIQSILLLIVIALGMFLYVKGPAAVARFPFLPQPEKVSYLQINGTKIQVEIADTQAKRSKGLGGRQFLASDSGMLFIFDRADRHSFWMKGLMFPLDFVWIKENEVVDILENIQPPIEGTPDSSLPVYSSKTEADKVLEVAAGTVGRFNVKVGDTVKLLQ